MWSRVLTVLSTYTGKYGTGARNANNNNTSPLPKDRINIFSAER